MSSELNASPEGLASASTGLGGVGDEINDASSAAAPPTTSIVPAAADEVSAAITRLFATYGQEFQLLSAHTAAFHARFVQLLFSGGAAYGLAEAANAALLWGGAGAGGSGGSAIGAGNRPAATGVIGGGNGGAGGFANFHSSGQGGTAG
jgi:hypothetical protein